MPRATDSFVGRVSKGLPAGRMLLVGEIALQASRHLGRLDPRERRRLAVLFASGARRRGALTRAQRAELARLVAKTEPRLFLGSALRRVSPVPIPRRISHGKRAR